MRRARRERRPQDIFSLFLEAAARELGAMLFGPAAARAFASKEGRARQLGMAAGCGAKAYMTLGVLPSAPRTVIEAAYRALAKDLHPDVGGSEAQMQALNAAMAAIRKERGWKR